MSAFGGVYDISEVGRYLYVTAPRKPAHATTVRRWVRSGLPTAELHNVEIQTLFLTFEDLISLRMVVALRTAGFSLQHVRKVHNWLQETTGYPRPFVLRDLWISESEIFIDMKGLFSATRNGQRAMDFLKEWLRLLRRPDPETLDLTFEKFNGSQRASAWTPYPFIVLNPRVQFGAPCVEGTRIPTITIWSMYLGGDAPKSIASDYGVSILKVQAAIEWEGKVAGAVVR